jgi:hypothetical protein
MSVICPANLTLFYFYQLKNIKVKITNFELLLMYCFNSPVLHFLWIQIFSENIVIKYLHMPYLKFSWQ